MRDDWFDALEKRVALDNIKPEPWWQDYDWIMAVMFVLFLAMCAADIV